VRRAIIIAALAGVAALVAAPGAGAGVVERKALAEAQRERSLRDRESEAPARPRARTTQVTEAGVITNVTPVSDGSGRWTATYTASSTYCTDFGYCGWYANATQIPAGQACNPYDTSNLTFVGSAVWESPGPFTESDVFYPMWSSGTLCLHINQGDSRRVTVAQATYVVGQESGEQPPAVPTEPAGPVIPDEPEPLSASEAKSSVRNAIRKKTRRAPRKLKYGCARVDDLTFECRSSWFDSRYIYAGTFDIQADADTIYWKFRGLRASHRCLNRYSSSRVGVRRCSRRVNW
jgi:hypothetical protein